jgi:DNA-binding IclR family transcriptional regulator
MTLGAAMTTPDSSGAAPAARTASGVERALDVLMLFSRTSTATLGVSEIARQLGLSKAVVHRILAALCGRRLVEVDPHSRRYRPGPASLAVGRAFLDRIDIRDLAREPLRRLSRATDETSTLSIPVLGQRVYLDQVMPDREVRMTVRIGQPYPLHAGSSSKALLAFLPAEELAAHLASGPLPALTDRTVVDPASLRDELRAIRERGYAVSFGERQAGAGSVAAPVLDHTDHPVAALSVCGPLERVRSRVAELAALLLPEVKNLSAQLGAS